MVGAEQVVHLWKEWGIQVLVLLSFMLQVMLLVLSGFRKSMDNGVLRALIWLAYQLADSIAIYVLGHLSITGRSPRDQLMAFWAPFLLLHLGGQDNITAYAMEDNQLWLRHLQTMVVQVAACSYVLYKSSIPSSDSLLRWATMIIFVASIVKYGERVWVLKRASSAPSGGNYRSYVRREDYYSVDLYEKIKKVWGTEALLLIAHHLLDVPMDFLTGPTSDVVTYRSTIMRAEEVYEVVEMQLSLMHDVFYTKAEVINTWYGICIRIILVLGTAAALILSVLQLGNHKDSYKIVDVIVTYVLLVGALVLEITSLLRAMFSSWTCTLLLKWSIYDSGEYRSKARASLCRVVASLCRLIHAAGWGRRYWLGSVGQHNLLQLCVRGKASRRSKIARWLGVEDPWNTLVYSWSIPISTGIKQLVIKQVLRSLQMSEGHPDHIINSRGTSRSKQRPAASRATTTHSGRLMLWRRSPITCFFSLPHGPICSPRLPAAIRMWTYAMVWPV
ncbi:hypothetical protein PVAP13_7NG007180 [Panicum virgatum]|uniref:DUF4220 domain-containing protein n=1 Tax=Panicum virgatum TaxID=38727 RepID=A0A8T0Q1K1_PANVG|nr:hypothetical protein PVAP13_7NG007180 [Panicum virgatum]